MFIAVVTIFAICWLPYQLFYIYAYHQPYITSTNNTPHLFLAFYWLAMSNCMVNPIIYYWMNRRFRHYFQRILCFCYFRLWKVDDTFSQSNAMSIERKPRLCKYYRWLSRMHKIRYLTIYVIVDEESGSHSNESLWQFEFSFILKSILMHNI